jgi:hypothetical protein
VCLFCFQKDVEATMNAFTQKPDVSKFVQATAQSKKASQSGTKTAERHSVLRTSSLPIFKKEKK